MSFSALLGQRSTPTLLNLLLKAVFIALVSFGGPAGVLIALFPTFFFNLTGGLVCPRGSELVMDQWNDGSSTQFRLYCASPDSSVQPRDITLFSLAVLLGMFFLAFFYIALIVLLIIRARNKAKYGAE